MKYRQYRIVHFAEIEDNQFGRSVEVLAKTAGLDPSCDVGFPETDLYGNGEFSELFIVPYDNEVMDEIEGIAQCNELWSPDTKDWCLDEQNRIIDGVSIIAHHYCGDKKEKPVKSVAGNFHIVSWMPLCRLIEAENAPLKQTTDKDFVCGSVKGHISPTANKVLGYENSNVSDFKVAMVSIHGAKTEPWLLVASNPHTKIIDVPEQMMADILLEIGQWRQAFPWAKKAIERGLAKMQEFYIESYDTYEEHRNDDPEKSPIAGAWHDGFVDANAGSFLPAIKNMLRLFDMAINDIDICNATMNYEEEIDEIKCIVDKMHNDCSF